MLRSAYLARSWKKLALPLMVAAACLAFHGPAGATVATTFTADLFLTTSDPIGPGGTVVSSVSGTVNGIPVTGGLGIFGSNQKIYSTNLFVDAFGLGFTETGSPNDSFNLYDVGTAIAGFDNALPGPLGVCYVSTCDNVNGFYAVSDFSYSLVETDPIYHVQFTFAPAPVPEPSSIALLAVAFLGFGLWGCRAKRNLVSGGASV